MISAAMAAKLSEQVGHEFFASQSYLAMACMFSGKSLSVLAGKFRAQTEEERGHALKILDYLLEVGATVTLQSLPAPRSDYPTAISAIEAAVEHEKKVTRQIHELVALAEKEQDYATRSFLQWFVDEQVEEVSSMSTLVEIARMAGENLLQLEAYVARAASK